ncbi:FkbM family methyltransferase [Anaerobium acetethylicum]|uniref:Methyltransferase, FkbM family n=1 Tax=Anaerobium acetethylicum TaxID=1619234 RepID=A0A1D3TQI1_9FIRM|nr:FkbM family methyltransferase [Anaerobium acetethylicum]SCP95749.1 methyltransferase, FkbM family [Anaerobium acetethylicum]
MEFGSIEEKVIYEKLKNGMQVDCRKNNGVGTSNTIPGSDFSNETINQYFDEITRNIAVMNSTSYNTSNRLINSYRGKLGILAKRAIRKILRWYIEPVCEQQSAFNNAVTPSIGRMTEIMDKLKEQNHEMQTILNMTNSKLNEIADRIEEADLPALQNTENNFWIKKTAAQSGEDAIVAFILMELGVSMNECKYLDLGANHAKFLSNTFYFYSQGARGVLVEANPALIPELKFYRHGDVILNKCITTKSNDIVEFYVLNGDGLSTPDKDAAEEFIRKNPALEIKEVIKVETISVNDIIETYFGEAPTIVNIDIEGKELEVLESINWDKYRPVIVIAEMIEYKPKIGIRTKNSEILDFMKDKGYEEYAFTGINSIFIDKARLGED